MYDANETKTVGCRSRLDQDDSNRYWWQHFPFTIISGAPASTASGLDNRPTTFYDAEHSDCGSNFTEEDEDTTIGGYGSITKNFIRKGKDNEGQFFRSESFQKKNPSLLSCNCDNLPTLSVDFDEKDSLLDRQKGNENRLARLQNRKRSLVAWLVMALLSYSYLAFCGVGMLTRPSYGKNNRNMGLGQIFDFDTLFAGVKKKPPRHVLERPPPLARSILLVLRAEVTPENVAVKDMDRQLTAKGMRDAEGLGIYLMQHNIPEPDWIFVSPSERTAFTTELMRRHWASEAPVAFEDILYTLEFNDYMSFVAGLNDQFRRVMIVGHNPAILNTAKKLMKTHGIEDFPDCGFMELRWNNLVHWKDVQPSSGSSTMALDPNNNFFFSSPR